MASELKLSGTTARVILQGNDTISSDQTFTFPDSGGEVLTTAGNTDNTGSGGSSGSAEVVGYQQGLIPVVDSGAGTTFKSDAAASWSRIGNTVFLQGYISVDSQGNSSPIAIKLPYKVVGGSGGEAENFNGPVMWKNWPVTNVVLTMWAARNGQVVNIYANSLGDSSWTSMKGNDLDTDTTLYFSLTYRTDNTNWTPINGATVS